MHADPEKKGELCQEKFEYFLHAPQVCCLEEGALNALQHVAVTLHYTLLHWTY